MMLLEPIGLTTIPTLILLEPFGSQRFPNTVARGIGFATLSNIMLLEILVLQYVQTQCGYNHWCKKMLEPIGLQQLQQ